MSGPTTDVSYAGYSFLGQRQPIPFIAATTDYIQVGGGTFALKHNITLAGELLGCGKDELWKAVDKLQGSFAVDFKELTIEGAKNYKLAAFHLEKAIT